MSTATAAPKTDRYKVNFGTYWTGDEYDKATGRQTKPPTPYGPSRKSDVVESTTDLTKLNDKRHPAGPRFTKLGDSANEVEARLSSDLKESRDRGNQLAERLRKTLDRMTAKELVEYAEAEEIDLKGETKRDPALKKILEALSLV